VRAEAPNENGRHGTRRPLAKGSCEGLFAGGSSSGVFFLLLLLGGALESLLARLCLVRVVAGFALHDAGLIEEAGNAVGRLGALGEPFLGAVGVDLDAVCIV